MSSFDPLKLRPNDPLEKYRDAAERQEREFERQRRREEHRERRAALADEKAARQLLEARLAASEARLAALEEANRELTANLVELAQATTQAVDTFEGICEKIDQRNEVQKLKDIMVEKLRAYEAEAKERFRFAREKESEALNSHGEITDVPSFLSPKQVN
jgi:hypothetical protein